MINKVLKLNCAHSVDIKLHRFSGASIKHQVVNKHQTGIDVQKNSEYWYLCLVV